MKPLNTSWWKVVALQRMGTRVQVQLLASIAVLAGCTAVREEWRRPRPMNGLDYVIEVRDDPEDGKIDVKLVALATRALCTGPARWPNQSGHFGGAGISAAIESSGRIFWYKQYDMESCAFEGCSNPMKNGMALEADLHYKDFDLPDSLVRETKELKYDPEPYWCPGK